MTRVRSQLLVLTASVGFASALVKNIGALAMLMPAAFQMAKKNDTSPSVFLMPMAFASLLGGLMTLVGTSPNIIVSRVARGDDRAAVRDVRLYPVGLGLLVIGLRLSALRLSADPARSPRRADDGRGARHQGLRHRGDRSPDGSPAIGETVDAFLDRHDREVTITQIAARRDAQRAARRRPALREGDVLILGGEPDALERVIAGDRLKLEGEDRDGGGADERRRGRRDRGGDQRRLAAGRADRGRLDLQARYGVNLIAISRQGEQLSRRLANTVLRGGRRRSCCRGRSTCCPSGCANSAACRSPSASCGWARRGGLLPIAILAVAMARPRWRGAGGGRVLRRGGRRSWSIGALPVREAYDHVEWPILIMLGALIPVSDSLRTTGATDVIATWLGACRRDAAAWGAVALILVAAMAVTPFLNNAATVLVMAPIAATFAAISAIGPRRS